MQDGIKGDKDGRSVYLYFLEFWVKIRSGDYMKKKKRGAVLQFLRAFYLGSAVFFVLFALLFLFLSFF